MTPIEAITGILKGTVEAGVTGGALEGGTLKDKARVGDTENAISLGTAAAFIARDVFKESVPFYREYGVDGVSILPTFHFLRGLRRQLSGDIEFGTSTFSPEEDTFYQLFQDWSLGTIVDGELLIAVEALDQWLVDEVTETAHPEFMRDYLEGHKWYKVIEGDTSALVLDGHEWAKITTVDVVLT